MIYSDLSATTPLSFATQVQTACPDCTANAATTKPLFRSAMSYGLLLAISVFAVQGAHANVYPTVYPSSTKSAINPAHAIQASASQPISGQIARPLPARSVQAAPPLTPAASATSSTEDANYQDPNDAPVTANQQALESSVNAAIQDQQNTDVTSGEVVAPQGAAPVNDEAITSIENKDGKKYTTTNLSSYARQVNSAVWSPNMRRNTAMTVKLQALLDWNHASPGPIDGGWGMNSSKALSNFQTMQGLPVTGRMDTATWQALTKNIDPNQPVLIQYTITPADSNTRFAPMPTTAEAKSKTSGLHYENIREMLAERFHMDIRYLEKLNPGKSFTAGETITVINVGEPLHARVDRVVADKAAKTLFAYQGDKLVATYPTTVGSSATPSPSGGYRIVNKVKMPWYRATVGEGENQHVYMLPPGPNSPVGVVWMGLSKPSYGIHGSPIPEGISRQASLGCIRLTNWDVLELYANIEQGATVELK